MKKLLYLNILSIFVLSSIFPKASYSWGFHAHRIINRHAVFTLPPEMFGFFKKHIEYITEHAVDPDKRSMVSEKEAVRHYIDIDHYGESPFDSVPQFWFDAVEKYTIDTLNEYGINPWHINLMTIRLTKAFEEKNLDDILFTASNMGHYIADATVPLHTTKYYDGKTKAQKGIHAFWETRIPELFSSEYDYFVGRASYIRSPLKKAWSLVEESHFEVDTIFMVEEYMSAEFPADRKFSFADKGQITTKAYSKEYSKEFSNRMNSMVERKLKTAIKAVGSFWYTAWVNAGQPNLMEIKSNSISDTMKKENELLNNAFENGTPKGRPNPE